MAKGVTIVAVPPVGQVAQLGTDQARGVYAEDVSWDHSLPDKGARQAQFTLRRRPEQEWPDLQPFTPITIYKAGSVAWSGRIQQTPTIRGRENQITVICEGWPAHLKDDALEKIFVHNDLTAWRDSRSYSAFSLATWASAYQVEASGVPRISVPNGTTVPITTRGGITFDAGPYSTIKRFVVTWIGGGHANFGLSYFAGDTPANIAETAAMDTAPISTAAFTQGFTLATARRYITLYVESTALTNVATDDAWCQLQNIILFADTTYESGNLSILKASNVIAGVLPYAPKISQNTIGIAGTAFNVPHYAGPLANPGDYMDAANDYHGYQLFLRDAADGGSPSVVFRAVPTGPLLVANVGSGIEFNDASRNDGSEIYNRVVVEYTDAAGNTAREERTTSGLGVSFTTPAITFEVVSPVQPPNPSFDASTASWSVATGTLTRDTVVFDTTPASGRGTTAGAFPADFNTTLTGLTVGKRYRLRFAARDTAAAVGDLFVFHSVGGIQQGFQSFVMAVTFGTFTYDFTATASSVTIRFSQAGPIATDVIYVDSLALFEARPTIVDRQGFLRTRVLATGSRLTAAAAQQIGDVYLQAHRFTPLRGSLTVQGAAIRTIIGDVPIPAHLLGGRNLGDAILINETDPDLGIIGRVGIINAVSYDESSDTANISIDTNKDFIAQLLARLQVFS